MLQAVFNAFRIPDLRKKIFFTIGMLLIFRLIAHIPLPNVDHAALDRLFQNNAFLGTLNLFSGSALRSFSIAMMGVYPYITASIIVQLLTPIIPKLDEWSKEGESGRARVNRVTHILTVPIGYLQAYGQIRLAVANQVIPANQFGILNLHTFLPSFTLLTSTVAATMILVWIGELITENGVGNGVSIIIFGGIVAGIPSSIANLVTGGSSFNLVSIILFAGIGLLTIVGIILINEGIRKIPVQYARRVRGQKQYGGQATTIPLRVNSAGMIPLIFAVSIMILPSTIANFLGSSDRGWLRNSSRQIAVLFDPGNYPYQVGYFLLVVGFTFFYTIVVFNQQNIPENLQKNGGFVPGIRPGRPTSDYLTRVLNRITLAGALFLGIVAILPFFARLLTGITQLGLGSTALLIVVGVAIDTMRQLEAQLLMRNYEGFIR
ncbi:MAG: preprotein translocase subunit SecY [Thermomicrobia bacterium]|nr:preprotein translocase subunit SecY [Thermomicrobia bacterium]MCA1722848.1 preprotein translocase subunit SecY [Thermomicrobia bacterium]